MGDVVIMLPYIQDLREKLSADVAIDLLTREETEAIPRNLNLFSRVYSLGGWRNTKKQLLAFLFLFPSLLFRKYDCVIDLQNNNLTKVMRFFLNVKTFSLFDKVSANYAGDRYKKTINALGLAEVEFKTLTCFKEINEQMLLAKYGLQKNKFVVINPAGAFETRNWNLDNYVEFCILWLMKNPDNKFAIIGLSKINYKANYLKEKLGVSIVDLVEQTTPFEALQILQHAKLVLSEDSGLLHMSYVVGSPTIGMLGSTRNDWTNPNLPHTYFFNSSDLFCGNCMLEKCRFAETICLARIHPADILNTALQLLEK